MINMSSKVLLFSTFQIVHCLRHLTSSSTDTGQLSSPLWLLDPAHNQYVDRIEVRIAIFLPVLSGGILLSPHNLSIILTMWELYELSHGWLSECSTWPEMIFFLNYNFQRVESIIPFIERLNLSFDQINRRYLIAFFPFSILSLYWVKDKVECFFFFFFLFTQKSE